MVVSARVLGEGVDQSIVDRKKISSFHDGSFREYENVRERKRERYSRIPMPRVYQLTESKLTFRLRFKFEILDFLVPKTRRYRI